MVPRRIIPLWNPLDPLGGLGEAFAEAQKWAMRRIQEIILNPSDELIRSRVVADITLAQNNLALWLSYWLFGLILLWTVLTVKNGHRLGYAFVVWILLSAFAPVWSDIVWELRKFGLNFAETLSWFEAANVDAFNPPALGDPIAAILFGGTNFALGIVLASLLGFYEFVIIAFQLWALPAVAISSIGPRSRKFSNIVIAFGLTATVGGRAAAIFFLEGAMWMIDTAPFGKTAFGASIYTAGGIAAAFLFQFILVFVFYHAVVFAQNHGKALVSGTVAATINKVVQVDMRKLHDHFNPQPMPVHVVSSASDGDEEKRARQEGRRRKAATAAEAGATATGHPEAGLVLGAILRK